MVYERFYFPKNRPIRVIENFSGIGTQAMALKRLGKKYNIEFEFVAMSEIDKYAIKSYEAIHGETLNLGAIGSFDRFPKDIDICSWSFPCQDISIAGHQKGLQEDTRSNYGYVFLDTVENTPYNERPKVLLMENVPALVSAKFQEDYKEIHYRLERMGYTSWGGLLNAKDYGVAQSRERIFIVSILGDYSYTFPKPFHLKKKLKDYLEHQVDEKYYLSEKMIKTFTTNPKSGFERTKQFENALFNTNVKGIGNTVTTRAGSRAPDNFIIEKNKKQQLVDDLLKEHIVKEGDVINHSYTSSKQRPNLKDFVENENGIMPTLHTRPDIFGVVVGTYQHSKSDNFMKGKDRFQPGKEIADTIVTNTKEGVVELYPYGTYMTWPNKKGELNTQCNRASLENGNALTIATTQPGNVLLKNHQELRIRKLTPLETWRLMGIDDSDFYKAQQSGMSDAQLYKQAGNAIVVDVLYYIFKNLFIEEQENEL